MITSQEEQQFTAGVDLFPIVLFNLAVSIDAYVTKGTRSFHVLQGDIRNVILYRKELEIGALTST